MKTKDRILATALRLFNEYGISDVTLRQIALAMSISQGNLNYHFKLKSDLISALYYQLVHEMDGEMNKLAREQPLLPLLYSSSYISMKTLYKYRFLMMDLYKILSADPALKEHYFELQAIRKQQYIVLFTQMEHQGLLRKEELEGEYERLYTRMNILGDNWINASLFFDGENPSMITYYHTLLFEVIYPYLTLEGKARYKECVTNSDRTLE